MNVIQFLSLPSKPGKASDGSRRILDIQPTELHQRVPFFVGTESMVEKAESFIREYPDEA